MPPRPASSSGVPAVVRLLAAAVVLQLLAGLAGVAVLSRADPQAASAAAQGPAQPSTAATPSPSVDPEQVRTAAVTALLMTRADAVMSRDQAAFLSVVDPSAGAFRARQEALFDALAEVPLSSWYYELDATREQARTDELDRRHGPEGWWAPDIALRYALTGIDTAPAFERHVLTFVERDGRWLLAADDDFAGARTARNLWDSGPVIAVRGEASLVLGRPASRRLLTRLAAAADAAVPRVTKVWGTDWPQAVAVLVPDSQAELGDLLGRPGELSQIAAVATAEIITAAGTTTAVGDRIIINPRNFDGLGPVGRQVVLTHEVAHVATRKASGPSIPAWLVEGLADYVGYRDAGVSVTVAARELRAEVQAGRLPLSLPTDFDFRGDNPDLAQAYEKSWLAVVLLADLYGEDAMLRFYRAVGASDEATPARAVESALAAEFGTEPAAFTAAWRDLLQRRLG